MLSKCIFVGNFLKKSQSSLIYVFKVGTRGFNKISIKLLNRCVGLSGTPDIGVPFRSSGLECHSVNVIYYLKCKICNEKKKYIGKTKGDNTKGLKVRINQHVSDCKTTRFNM